jgi:hypothetical protein
VASAGVWEGCCELALVPSSPVSGCASVGACDVDLEASLVLVVFCSMSIFPGVEVPVIKVRLN